MDIRITKRGHKVQLTAADVHLRPYNATDEEFETLSDIIIGSKAMMVPAWPSKRQNQNRQSGRGSRRRYAFERMLRLPPVIMYKENEQ
jgi:hypothetical protein